MATSTARGTSTLVKEKRGISPSNSGITHSERCTKQSPTIASTHKVKSPQSAPTAQKQVPNYLRPTVSSRHESFKYVKKTGPEDHTTQKPNLLRRRSFDKPPSASPRGDKALISPGPRERAGPARERVITVRTSSFSHKLTTSPKPIVDKISKTPKLVKSQLPFSKSIKKTPSPSIKKETNASASRKASSSHDVTQTLNLETKLEDIEPVVHEVEEVVNVESEVQVPCEIPISDNKEHVDVVDTEVNNVEDEKVKSSDVSTVTSEDPPAVEIEETEEKSHEEKTKTQHESEENHSKDESNESHPEESLASEAKIEAEEKGEENASEKAASSEETGDENKVEGKEQGDEGREGVKLKEGEQVEGVVEEAKPEEAKPEAAKPEAAKPEAANVVSKRQGGQGKKESPAAYNDVIEETASRLLEKRKNKVKALVGAFETVIDYESSSK